MMIKNNSIIQLGRLHQIIEEIENFQNEITTRIYSRLNAKEKLD